MFGIPADVLSVIILGICIVLFLINKIGSCTVSVIGCTLMGVLGCCTFKDAYSGFYSNSTVLIVGMLVVGVGLYQSGVGAVIGRAVIKLSNNNERRFAAYSFLFAALMSMWIADMAVTGCFLAIINSVALSTKSMKRINLLLPATMGACFGGGTTAIGSTTQLTAGGIMATYFEGYAFKLFDLAWVGVPAIIIGTLYIYFYGYKIGLAVWGSRDELEIDEDAPKVDLTNINKRMFITMSVIGVVMVISYITQVVASGYIAVIAAILSIITGCTNEKTALKNVDWATPIRFAACLGIAEGLKVARGGTLLANWVTSVFGSNISPFMLIVVFATMAIVLSNFIANSTVCIILLPILYAFVIDMKLNPIPFTLAVTQASIFSVATPLANGPMGVSFGAGYRFYDYFRVNKWLTLLVLILVIIMCSIVWPLRLV